MRTDSPRSLPRVLLLVLVVALVALAGCSSGGEETTDPGDIETDAPTTAMDDATPTEDDGMEAPTTEEPVETTADDGGTTTTAEDDETTTTTTTVEVETTTEEQTDDGGSGTEIGQGQSAALQAAGSFTVQTNLSIQTVADGQQANLSINQTVLLDLDNQVGLSDQQVIGLFGGDSVFQTTTYTAGEETYIRQSSGGQVNYQYGSEPYTGGVTPVNFSLAQSDTILPGQSVGWSQSGSTTVDGVAVTQYTASGAENFGNLSNLVGTGLELQSIEDVSVDAYVDGDGIVRLLNFQLDGIDSNGNDFSLSQNLQITAVGSTSVQAPDWLEEAQQQTSN